MTWTFSSISSVPNPKFPTLLRTVSMVFENINTDGVSTDTHTYTEPNVSDVSLSGLRRLIDDQLRQLNVIEAHASTLDDADLTTRLKTLIAGPVVSPETTRSIAPFIDDALSDIDAANALNASTVDNPISKVPKIAPPINVAGLLGLLSEDERGSLADSPNTTTIRADARLGDAEALVQWAVMRADAGLLSQATLGKIVAACQPIDDPSWTAKVSRASLAIGRTITPAEVRVIRALVS